MIWLCHHLIGLECFEGGHFSKKYLRKAFLHLYLFHGTFGNHPLKFAKYGMIVIKIINNNGEFMKD